jgi:O-acetylserine/cysteine efflux transporter
MNYILWSVSTALFFSATFLLRKLAVKTVPFNLALLVEVVIETVLLTAAFFIIPGGRVGLIKYTGFGYAALAGVMVTLGVGANILALKSGFLSRVTGITSPSQIIFSVLLGTLLLRESFSLTQFFGAVLAVVGIILMIK